MVAPRTSGSFEPSAVEIRPLSGLTTSIAMLIGSRKRPACVTDAPKPKPVLRGSSTNCGTRMNAANMPKPSSSVARFVVHTPRSRIMRMSTRGTAARSSTRTQTTTSTAVAANRPSVGPEAQPQRDPSLTPSRRQMSQPESRAAPAQLIRPGVRKCDSGTKRSVATPALSTTTRGIQNSQWYERCAMIGPERTIPRPPPMPSMPEIRAMPLATRSRGNSSRMMP